MASTGTTEASESVTPPPVAVPSEDGISQPVAAQLEYPEYVDRGGSWVRSALITGVVALLILCGLLFATTPIQDTVFAKWLGLEPKLVVDETDAAGVAMSEVVTPNTPTDISQPPIRVVPEGTVSAPASTNPEREESATRTATVVPESASAIEPATPATTESTWTPPDFSNSAPDLPPEIETINATSDEPTISAPTIPPAPTFPEQPQNADAGWNLGPKEQLPEMIDDPRFTGRSELAASEAETAMPPSGEEPVAELDLLPTVEPVKIGDAGTTGNRHRRPQSIA